MNSPQNIADDEEIYRLLSRISFKELDDIGIAIEMQVGKHMNISDWDTLYRTYGWTYEEFTNEYRKYYF